MDPVSAVIGIASGAAGLIALTGQVVTRLVALRDTMQNAELIILDLMSTCQAYRTAWTHIEKWASQRSEYHQQQDSTSIVLELDTFLKTGKIIMNLVQNDVVRIAPKRGLWQISGRRVSKDGFKLLLHEKTISEHAARIHRQNTSLNLLISVLTLPSIPLQEAAVEVLRPKFRKDEETAWTLVNTHSSPASHDRKRALASSRGSVCSSIFLYQSVRHGGSSNRFSFEDDLFSGPVYKRLLVAKLCEQPMSGLTLNRTQSTILESGQNSRQTSKAVTVLANHLQSHQQNQNFRVTRRAATIQNIQGTTSYSNIHEDDALALELRQQGIFSRSIYEDYCEFLARHRPRKMQRRHLPLASVLIQSHIDVDEQHDLNSLFHNAIRQCDIASAAKALDSGAEINSYQNGHTALEFCIQKWLDTKASDPDLPSEYTTIAEFLMLYKETSITYMFDCRATILHLCMHIGATAEFMEPFFEIESPEKAICYWDRYGRTILHTAVLASASGLFALEQINNLYGAIPTQRIVDEKGVNVCALAQLRKANDHLSILMQLAEAHPKTETHNKLRLGKSTGNLVVRDSRQGDCATSAGRVYIFITNPDPVDEADDGGTLDHIARTIDGK